jgi:hypothetical protein
LLVRPVAQNQGDQIRRIWVIVWTFFLNTGT